MAGRRRWVSVVLVACAAAAACTATPRSVGSAPGSPATAATAAPTVGAPPPAPRSSGSAPATTTPGPSVPEPRIVARPIPFGPERKAEMAAYATRHYGIDTWRLVAPKVIVEHFTAGTTFASAWNTFAANTPDPGLGELPGVCSHFLIDTDGTIAQLVPLGVMCRHTVGLNDTAIGIEMVGTSDQEILSNPRQFGAALALTAWLMQRFGIQLRNVIGHNESLTSPYHHERYAAWRCQTHMDWNHANMQVFRGRLATILWDDHVPIGPPATPVDSGCP